MQIVKVLSRRDAYSVLLAVVLAMSIQGLLTVTYFWANDLLNSGGSEFGGPSTSDAFKNIYGPQALSALMQIAAIELFLWLVALLKGVNRPVRAKK